jgi:MFS transporter, DHA2 family, multidrug resistance protein
MHTSVENQLTPQAGRRDWLGLLVLVLPALVVSVDLSVLFLALPKLAEDLLPGSTQQLWIVDIYGFMLAGFLVTMGTLGDRIGRRKLLLTGGAVFGIASVLAAYATSPEMLIAARALLGIAGATLAPSTLALITNMFKDPEQRGTAIAVWTSCFMGGIVLGPIVGGFMLSQFWWGSVFLLAVPVMVLLLVAGPLLLPEYRNPRRRTAGSVQCRAVPDGRLPVHLRHQGNRSQRLGTRAGRGAGYRCGFRRAVRAPAASSR